ncbi:hypothetical protein N7478_007623 [Penicillium angulare]|uniref:uncharacterized protein n=1 Tax=Penicillium angulare TaxID=116970 RepID=UPI00254181CC|nr:uncharacterized protein N7478_007623 [Penicillium angulare]KAJ5272498.1 hypothetical protein N7478_007623 [Penicillium angulare]
MRIDIDNGKYIATRYPPYFSNPHKRDENISPLDNSPSPPELSFWNIITIPQRQRYYDQVEATLNNILNEQSQASTFTKTLTSTSTSTSTSTTLSPDAELSVLLAHYKVDYHIHQHYLSYRVPITLCRDAHDLHSLRKWNWKMAEIDAVIHSESKPEPGSEPNSSNSNTREWPVGCRKLGWPDDETLKMVHQTLLWKRAWRGRQKKLEEVRARWVVIMEERRRERELLFARQAELLVKEASASASTFTVKVYCRGELRDVRELKRMAYSEPGLRVKRAAQSFGV